MKTSVPTCVYTYLPNEQMRRSLCHHCVTIYNPLDETDAACYYLLYTKKHVRGWISRIIYYLLIYIIHFESHIHVTFDIKIYSSCAVIITTIAFN